MEQYTAYELNRSTEAPCDSLYVCFPFFRIEEIVELEAWQGTQCLFSGPVDDQRVETGPDGSRVKLWARNKAAYLVDNECVPCSYQSPTADTLFLRYAAAYQLQNGLPPILLQETMDIPKGTSRWGAIHMLVKNVTGHSFTVDSGGTLRLLEPTGVLQRFSDRKDGGLAYQAACMRTRRSQPVAEVRYKTENTQGYNRRAESALLKQRGICTSRCLNLSALPSWQRKRAAELAVSESMKKYQTIVLTVPGAPVLELCDTALLYSSKLGEAPPMLITDLCWSGGRSGCFCKVTMCREQEAPPSFFIEE